MKVEELIYDFVYNFVDNNWGNIHKKRCEITKNKKEFLKEVRSDLQTALWVISEVACWGMNTHYLEDVYINWIGDGDVDFTVLKIDGMFIKMEYTINKGTYKVKFIKPKTKEIIYFE